MAKSTFSNPLIGKWTYRSFLSIVDPKVPFDKLKFGVGTLEFVEAPMQDVKGSIGGPGWKLDIKGSMTYGNPMTARFQGKGKISGVEWIYDYEGYLVKPWPNGVEQIPAIVGTIVRTIPHPSNGPGSKMAPAGFVAQWIAVRVK